MGHITGACSHEKNDLVPNLVRVTLIGSHLQLLENCF